MRKSKSVKTLSALALGATILSGIVTPVSAVESDEPTNVVIDEPSDAIAYDGTVYEPAIARTGVKKAYWTHVAKNTASTSDQVTYSVSRSLFSNGTVSGEAEFKILQKGVKVSAEVSLGTNTTKTTTFAFTIPARSTRKLVYGSIYVDTDGQIVRYSNGVKASAKNVGADYTRSSYSENLAY